MNCNYKVSIKDIQSKYTFKIFCAGDTSTIEQEIGNLSDLTTTAKNNLVSAINEVHSDTETNATAISGLQSGKEDKSNKVTSISSASTDTQYPSAKAVYDSQETQNETISTLESNLEETQAELDYYKTIYNVLPKVSGEGESLSLNNTGESILKTTLKGNTSQFSTTGKNLLNESSLATYTMNGLTWKYEDNIIKISGQASSTYSQSGRINIDLPAGTYTFSKFGTTSLSYNCWIYNSGGTLIGNTKLNNPVTINEDAAKIELFVEGLTSGNNYNEQINAMVSTSSGDYEPYTGGIASPNPDYPQDIHVVKGDNEINVEGNNLFDLDWFTFRTNNGITATKGDGYVLLNGTATATAFINYAIPRNLGTSVTNYWYVKSDSAGIMIKVKRTGQNDINITPTAGTQMQQGIGNNISYVYDGYIQITNGTTLNNCKVYIDVRNNYLSLQDYEFVSYNGDTYEIDLGVENLWKPIATTTKNGVTLTQNEDGSYALDGTSTSATSFYVSASYPVGTYSLSANNEQIMAGGADYLLLETQGGTSTNKTLVFSLQNNKATFDITSPITTLVIVISSGKTYNNFVIKPQLERGSKVNSFTKYGTIPIKMRGIGSYEDYFVRNSGKNLFDENQAQIGKAWNNSSNSARAIVLTPVKPNTQYTISYVNGSAVDALYWFDRVNENDSTYITANTQITQTTTTITTASNCNWLGIQFNKTNIAQEDINKVCIMLNEGSTVLPYEPYGTGLWCKYNAIGNVVLDGSENWTDWNLTGDHPEYITGYLLDNYVNYNNSSGSDIRGVCNNFVVYSNGWVFAQSLGLRQVGDTLRRFYVAIDKNITPTLEDYKTWLSTHNTTLDYVLASPYLSLIENETLISQLDKVEKALGKDGQTNISQINNDAPFKIYASALMKISGE